MAKKVTKWLYSAFPNLILFTAVWLYVGLDEYEKDDPIRYIMMSTMIIMFIQAMMIRMILDIKRKK